VDTHFRQWAGDVFRGLLAAHPNHEHTDRWQKPSAAAQYRDFLVNEGGRLVDFVRDLPRPGNDDDSVWASRETDKELAAGKLNSLPRAMKPSRGALEGSKWEMQ